MLSGVVQPVSLGPIEELELRRSETALLHRGLDISQLQVFRINNREWQPARVADSPVMLIHLWAVECPPCIAELSIWRDIVRAAQRSHFAKHVQFVFVTETYDDAALAQFLEQKKTELPPLPTFRFPASDRKMRSALSTDRQPITLLLDRRRGVRHAIIGPIADRRGELASAIERLIALLK